MMTKVERMDCGCDVVTEGGKIGKVVEFCDTHKSPATSKDSRPVKAMNGVPTEELKPCPFGCVGYLDRRVSGKSLGFIECMECGATGPERKSQEEAIAAWNQRHRAEQGSELELSHSATCDINSRLKAFPLCTCRLDAALTAPRESEDVSVPTFTEAERRVLLDLIDEENGRDRRTHVAGRTTPEVWAAQDAMYWNLRRKLVAISPTEDSTPG